MDDELKKKLWKYYQWRIRSKHLTISQINQANDLFNEIKKNPENFLRPPQFKDLIPYNFLLEDIIKSKFAEVLCPDKSDQVIEGSQQSFTLSPFKIRRDDQNEMEYVITDNIPLDFSTLLKEICNNYSDWKSPIIGSVEQNIEVSNKQKENIQNVLNKETQQRSAENVLDDDSIILRHPQQRNLTNLSDFHIESHGISPNFSSLTRTENQNSELLLDDLFQKTFQNKTNLENQEISLPKPISIPCNLMERLSSAVQLEEKNRGPRRQQKQVQIFFEEKCIRQLVELQQNNNIKNFYFKKRIQHDNIKKIEELLDNTTNERRNYFDTHLPHTSTPHKFSFSNEHERVLREINVNQSQIGEHTHMPSLPMISLENTLSRSIDRIVKSFEFNFEQEVTKKLHADVEIKRSETLDPKDLASDILTENQQIQQVNSQLGQVEEVLNLPTINEGVNKFKTSSEPCNKPVNDIQIISSEKNVVPSAKSNICAESQDQPIIERLIQPRNIQMHDDIQILSAEEIIISSAQSNLHTQRQNQSILEGPIEGDNSPEPSAQQYDNIESIKNFPFSSDDNNNEGLFKNWFDILRNRNLRQNQFIPRHFVLKRKKRKKLQPNREDIEHEVNELEQLQTVELPLPEIPCKRRSNIHQRLLNIFPKCDRREHQYLKNLTDQIDLGRAVIKILKAVISKGKVNIKDILNGNLQDNDEMLRIKAILELFQHKKIIRIESDGQEMHSISIYNQ